MSTQDYLDQLIEDKHTLVTNINTKGVEASDTETFTELVPKILEIAGGLTTEQYMRVEDLLNYNCNTNEDDYSQSEVDKVDALIEWFDSLIDPNEEVNNG